MNTENKPAPTCPYCGDEIEMKLARGWVFPFYKCFVCGSTSPAKRTEEEAYAAAMMRAVPAATQEISATEFYVECYRMCTSHALCKGCPILPERMINGKVLKSCPIVHVRSADFTPATIGKVVAIVENWA